MITISSKMEGRKSSRLMETVDIMDLIPFVESVLCITQDRALSAILCSLMILGSLKKFKKRSPEELKPRSKDTRLASAAILLKWGCYSTDDSLEQHQITDSKTSPVKSSLKVDKDWKEKFFYPANHDDDEPNPKVEKKTVIPIATKKEFVKPKKLVKRSVSCPNQQRKSIVSGNNYNKKDNDYYSKTSHSSAHKHMAPRAVLMKTDLKSINTARPVNTVRFGDPSNPMVHHWFSTNITTLMHRADPRFVDSGCSRHMTGNITHISDFKDFDRGYVTFSGGAYGGRITSKGKKVSPKTSHLLAVKRIFRYLKGKPSLGLWYPKDSPLELVAYTDSDYAGATQDRKSTTG
ncbi:putative ribonuclease H-like domain-containing protein, partial [Tanacetum coccineum]